MKTDNRQMKKEISNRRKKRNELRRLLLAFEIAVGAFFIAVGLFIWNVIPMTAENLDTGMYKVEAETNSKTETEPENETESETESETELETEKETEAETESETEPKHEQWMPHGEYEVALLAEVMYAEVGTIGEMYGLTDDEVELAHKFVGSVVLNRIASNRFPGDMWGVIFQPMAYASRTRDMITNGCTELIPKETFEWAEELLDDGPLGPPTLVFQAEFIQGETYAHIGNQYFCLLAE